ncbi:MAG: FAD-dependent oxidoreductase [Pirellulales bacterium]
MPDHDSHPTAFPRLSEAQMACVAERGQPVTFADGEVLFEFGQENCACYFIKSGAVRILESSCGEAREIVVHREHEFSGDIDVLTGRPVVVTGIACRPTEAYRFSGQELRRLLSDIPELSEMLLEAFYARRKLLLERGYEGIKVVGSARSRETLALREFFYRNYIPYKFLDTDEPSAEKLLGVWNASREDTPIVACHKHVLRRPAVTQIADCMDISRTIDDQLYDLVIVGAGPAGLSAAVYAASEGLSTVVVDRVGPGGQAGSSSRIENFIGFPAGISGVDLANRGYLQAIKFGAQFTAPVSVHALEQTADGEHRLRLCTGTTVRARCVLVATGVSCRQLGIEGCDRLEGAGVYYAATSVESRVCRNSTAVVVGGGNSAGQAAQFLAQHAQRVIVVIRGNDLSKSMSRYLVDRLTSNPRIEVRQNTEVDGVDGEAALQSIRLRNNRSGETETLDCAAVFIFIGAKPHTDWLPPSVRLDDKGFVMTGSALRSDALWSRTDRAPCDLETTLPGVMAAGDVRAGTTKRCGFAVGDGSLAISCVHRYLSGI